MSGKSLVKVCQAPGMPDRSTVVRWMTKDPEFATRCAHAREAQADYMDDLIMDEAEKVTPETAQAAKVKISAYQWRASKLAPKKYGDRVDMNVSGSLQTMSDEAMDARITELLGKAGVGIAAGGAAEAEEPK
jgi:hypothetical protein